MAKKTTTITTTINPALTVERKRAMAGLPAPRAAKVTAPLPKHTAPTAAEKAAAAKSAGLVEKAAVKTNSRGWLTQGGAAKPAVVKPGVAAQKLERAAKPAAKPAAKADAGLVRLACEKCGRENNRPAGAENGNCRVASACQARRRRAAEAAAKPAKGAKGAKPAAKPAAAPAPAPALKVAAGPRLVKTAKVSR